MSRIEALCAKTDSGRDKADGVMPWSNGRVELDKRKGRSIPMKWVWKQWNYARESSLFRKNNIIDCGQRGRVVQPKHWAEEMLMGFFIRSHSKESALPSFLPHHLSSRLDKGVSATHWNGGQNMPLSGDWKGRDQVDSLMMADNNLKLM